MKNVRCRVCGTLIEDDEEIIIYNGDIFDHDECLLVYLFQNDIAENVRLIKIDKEN